jgi:hypothetical protein
MAIPCEGVVDSGLRLVGVGVVSCASGVFKITGIMPKKYL